MSDSLYQQQLLALHQQPTGFAVELPNALEHSAVNAVCGDEIRLQLCCEQQTIKALSFHGDSCAVCRASASLLCEQLPGLSLEQAQQLAAELEAALADDRQNVPEPLAPLAHLKRHPIRIQCALLPWQAFVNLKGGIDAN
ncbi:iron-sulfur cluster assembly scaffold protein [Agaribacterium haliotis]|uniref:iron-sulfur cluster assembly scaffold protein n=1 Tax=Agaribacterium haliotis TaxID=2013869 RepID=UPI000BB594EF|nr:iron-sulfur cluster assembly scaffold protein [Agaribacterium haliotis]